MSTSLLAAETLAMLKGLRKDITTAGLSTSSNLTFYYLEQKAKMLYPVFYPLLRTTPRENPMFGGMRVGGPGVNWKAVVSIDANGYPALSEGHRNSYMNITTRPYFAPYKYLGKDNSTTLAAQAESRGFDDAVAIAQLSELNALLNDEERMLLFGNSGPQSVGGNGYALGQTALPTLAQSTSTSGALSASTTNYVFCVALTPWGQWQASATGLKLPYLRTNADGSQDQINGGTGIISAVAGPVTTDSSHKAIQCTVAASVGAVSYGWFLNTAANTTSGAYFMGVTSVPSFLMTTNPVTTNQQANATGVNSTSFSTDNSYNVLDFDGIMTWAFGTYGSSQPAYLADLGGAGFTSNGDGTIAEFEAVADYLWTNYKISIDAIYLGGNLIQAASRAVMTSSTGPGAQRLILDRSADGKVSGGQIINQYYWKYSNTAEPKTIPVRAHPWLPQGTVLFDLYVNPYPAAGADIPAVRRIMSLEDHFAIKWPMKNLTHEIGTYCFEALQCYIPFGYGILTGVAPKVN